MKEHLKEAKSHEYLKKQVNRETELVKTLHSSDHQIWQDCEIRSFHSLDWIVVHIVFVHMYTYKERPHIKTKQKKEIANGASQTQNFVFLLLLNLTFDSSSFISFVQIQNNKQIASSLKAKNSNRTAAVAAHLSPGAIASPRISGRWSNDEYQLAIKGMQKHGKDFQAVAEILGTKTEQQVSQFYTSNRKKFNLDDIIKEYETKQQREQQQKQKLSEVQRKTSTNSDVNCSDVKHDVKKPISDDDIMEVSNRRTE